MDLDYKTNLDYENIAFCMFICQVYISDSLLRGGRWWVDTDTSE